MVARICLYGPTGSGKTTIARHLVRRYGGELIKVATPLYAMQNWFYAMMGATADGQDGELLQFFAYKIEKERPGWLGERFAQEIRRCRRPLIVNDDCRLNSYPLLRDAGFAFVRVRTSPATIAARARPDHTPIDPRHPVEQGFEQFAAQHVIDNDGSLDDSLRAAEGVVDAVVGSADRTREPAEGATRGDEDR